MKTFVFLLKKSKEKENKSKELKTSFTKDDNNRIFIQRWLHNYIYKENK